MGESNARAQLLEVVRQVRRRWRIKLALRGAVGFLLAGLLAIIAIAYTLEALKFTPASIFWFRIVTALVLVAAGAWFFAPDSIKARLGIASSDKSPLELMVTTSDRQQLASGNELLAISGRVINPTAEEQAVPQIRAELRNKVSKKLVYQWTIAPPARSLPPGGSATFNSAEVDIPPGGDELTVTLASAAG